MSFALRSSPTAIFSFAEVKSTSCSPAQLSSGSRRFRQRQKLSKQKAVALVPHKVPKLSKTKEDENDESISRSQHPLPPSESDVMDRHPFCKPLLSARQIVNQTHDRQIAKLETAHLRCWLPRFYSFTSVF